MKSKEKRKILFGMLVILILVALYIGYSIYNKKMVVFASSEQKTNENIQISNAKKINVEEIITSNYVKADKEEIIIQEEDLEYITEYRNNKDLPKGTVQVIQEGRTGKQQITIKRIYNENQEVQEEVLDSITTIAAVNKIVEIGTSNSKTTTKVTKGSKIYVTSDRADVMKENNYQSDKLTTISKNTELVVKEVSDNWYKVSINGQTGWIKSENVTSVNPNPTEQTQNNVITKCDFNMALNKPSGLTLEQFKTILNDKNDVNNVFSDNAEYFYYIEQQYNINGVFVAAIGIHESGWGTSKISLNKKNLFGYGAYDSSPYNSSYSFSTYSEGIDLIARVLVKYYLNPSGTAIYGGEIANGKYYNGNTISAVNQKYATDKNWANKVYNYMEYLYKKI